MRTFVLLVAAASLGLTAASAKETKRKPDPNTEHVPRALTADETKAIETAIKAKLRDPYSAVIDGIVGADKPKLKVVAFCANVNGKNAYGAYEGAQQVYGAIKDGVASPVFLADILPTIARNRLVAAQNEEAQDRLMLANKQAAMVGMTAYERALQQNKDDFEINQLIRKRELRNQARPTMLVEAAAFIAKACRDNVE